MLVREIDMWFTVYWLTLCIAISQTFFLVCLCPRWSHTRSCLRCENVIISVHFMIRFLDNARKRNRHVIHCLLPHVVHRNMISQEFFLVFPCPRWSHISSCLRCENVIISVHFMIRFLDNARERNQHVIHCLLPHVGHHNMPRVLPCLSLCLRWSHRSSCLRCEKVIISVRFMISLLENACKRNQHVD
jgi:hypothetical protein